MEATPVVDMEELLARLSPEFPELVPAAIAYADTIPTYTEKGNTWKDSWGGHHFSNYTYFMVRGSFQWRGEVHREYKRLEKLHLETHPLPALEFTDEEILPWISFSGGSTTSMNLTWKKYAPDLTWEPDIAHAREHLKEIDAEKLPANNRSDRKLNCLSQLHQRIAEERDADILQAFHNSPEEVAKREAIRLAEEKAWAERDANLKFWEKNQRKRRVADMELPDLGRLDIHLLNHEGRRLAHKFYGEFFSPEFCGFTAEYRHRGYRLPPESGYHYFLFSVTGTVFNQSVLFETRDYKHYDENTAMIEGSNFIFIYAVMVCGYPADEHGWLSPNNYRRAVHGFANWVQQHTDVEEGIVLEHGTRQYWERLFNTVTMGIFDLQAENVVKDFPRNIHHSVLGYWGEEECSLFAELRSEKAFKEFLVSCERGILHHRSSGYFDVITVGRKKREMFQMTRFVEVEEDPLPIQAEELSSEKVEAVEDPLLYRLKHSALKIS
jgi:hypothetical protein